MNNSPENEQPQARDGADRARDESGADETEQIETPAEHTQEIATPQAVVHEPAAPEPATSQPAAPPTAASGTLSATQPPAGWGHPAPSHPAVPNRDPFALMNAYPAPSATETAPVAASTRARPQHLWVSVIGAAAAAAVIASIATVGLTSGFNNNNNAAASPSSLSSIGQSKTDTAPVSGSTSDNPNWEKVASAVSSSVVAIQVTTASGGAEGSGVILDAAGHVLTNNHVVAGAQDKTVQISLGDGRIYKATIVGTDTTTDLAVVQITKPPSDLKPAAIGDSGSVIVGAPVMAVGNPLGLANTVTTGIVSAIDRPVSASAETGADVVVTNAIQIDAAINPGNSGGPLFDAKGQVIGITSSIATLSGGSSTSGSIGLGFAIPINLAQNIAGQLVKSGTAEHAFLGVSLTDGTATADGTTRKGAVVEQVTAGSPAANAQVQKGDVIVAIDAKPVAGAESLTAYVRERSAGSTAKLTVVRDSKALDVTVTLAAKAATVDQSSKSQQGGSRQGGSRQGAPGSGPGSQNPFGQFFGGQG